MSNKLKALVDPIAGEYNWCIAGGGAAWWHIDHHMHTWHGAHDWAYFETIQEEIFPHDIEGQSMKEVVTRFPGKYGMIDLSLSELKKEQFDDVRLVCDQVDGILVYSPAAIIKRYSTVGNMEKQAKRDLRVALLKLVAARQPITQQGVTNNKPTAPNLVLQLAFGASKLRPVTTDKNF
jgi:hypothetical protein